MKPGKYDLPTIWRGCTYPVITFTWLNADGTPFDLTNWWPYAKSKQIDFGPVKTDQVNGVTTISLTKLQTETLELGTEAWDWIWVTPVPPSDPTTVTPPLLAGTVQIKEPNTELPVTLTITPPPP
jgi:hypothetical protein